MSNELTFILSLAVSLITITTFVLGRKEKGKQDGVEQGEMSNDIKYVKQTQTDILVSQREILNKLDKTNERVIRLEEQEKTLERRIDKLEKKKAQYAKLNEYANQNTKNVDRYKSQAEKDAAYKAAMERNSKAKPGSIASKANMVRDYNERNNK